MELEGWDWTRHVHSHQESESRRLGLFGGGCR